MYSSKEYQEAANDAMSFLKDYAKTYQKNKWEKYKIFSQQPLVWKYLFGKWV